MGATRRSLALVAALVLSFSAAAWAQSSRHRQQRSFSAKREFMKITGFPHGRPGYVIDHIIPLACGGADDPSNMQWQTREDAKAKDEWERKGCHGPAPRSHSDYRSAPAPPRSAPRGSAGKIIDVGPRGGVYHYSKSGKKVYEKKSGSRPKKVEDPDR